MASEAGVWVPRAEIFEDTWGEDEDRLLVESHAYGASPSFDFQMGERRDPFLRYFHLWRVSRRFPPLSCSAHTLPPSCPLSFDLPPPRRDDGPCHVLPSAVRDRAGGGGVEGLSRHVPQRVHFPASIDQGGKVDERHDQAQELGRAL